MRTRTISFPDPSFFHHEDVDLGRKKELGVGRWQWRFPASRVPIPSTPVRVTSCPKPRDGRCRIQWGQRKGDRTLDAAETCCTSTCDVQEFLTISYGKKLCASGHSPARFATSHLRRRKGGQRVSRMQNMVPRASASTRNMRRLDTTVIRA